VSDEREELAQVIFSAWADWYEGGSNPLWHRAVMDAVLAAGFRRQGPITDAQVTAAREAMADVALELLGRDLGTIHADAIARAALEAARTVS
jgi:tetrahydromethanopterin S-methyltransferase subunit H